MARVFDEDASDDKNAKSAKEHRAAAKAKAKARTVAGKGAGESDDKWGQQGLPKAKGFAKEDA